MAGRTLGLRVRNRTVQFRDNPLIANNEGAMNGARTTVNILNSYVRSAMATYGAGYSGPV
jgi:hypothetical protein